MQAFILCILYLLLYDRKQVLRVSLYELLFECGLPDCFTRFPLSYWEQDLFVQSFSISILLWVLEGVPNLCLVSENQGWHLSV